MPVFGRGRGGRVVDPPEPWERPAPGDVPPILNGVVSRPRCAADVPAGAWAALRDAVGPLGLDDLAVVPAGVRRVDSARDAATVSTQLVVLGAGAASAALWTSGRIWRVVPYGSLVAVRDEQVLLYGRLSLTGAAGSLSVRYNTVFRSEVEPLIRAVRRRAAGPGSPLPEVPEPTGLPYKWRRLVAGPLGRLDRGEPVRVVTGRRREGRSTRTVAALVVSARELVVMVEPDWLLHYGVDAYHLPRAGFRQASRSGPVLAVRLHDTQVELEVGDELAAAACRVLSGLLPAGAPG